MPCLILLFVTKMVKESKKITLKLYTGFQKAADLDDSDAMANLAFCYKNGEGIEKDHSKAVYWFHKAADLDDSDAMSNLAFCYKNGEGIEKDHSKAVYWFPKGC
ncbi:hypothetical protein GEMRC1_006368 [Eukaryota sp. GEM-RC1]